MKLALAAALLLGVNLVHAEEGLKPFKPGLVIKQSVMEVCELPTIPADAQIIGVHRYRGTDIDFALDHSDNLPSQIEVAVHADRPVVLLLSAYDPSIWNIGWSQGTKIVGVYVTGYHRQVVAGLPNKTPVVTSSLDSYRNGGCEGNYVAEGDFMRLSQELFKKPLTRLYTKPSEKSGVIEIFEAQTPPGKFFTSADRPPESYKDPKAPLPGKAGLDEALKKGIIRPVTPEDREAVKKAFLDLKKQSPEYENTPPVAGLSRDEYWARRIPLVQDGAYVILKEFNYPRGLHGGITQFVIPKGVPKPLSPPNHLDVIDLNTMSCNGVLCSR